MTNKWVVAVVRVGSRPVAARLVLVLCHGLLGKAVAVVVAEGTERGGGSPRAVSCRT